MDEAYAFMQAVAKVPVADCGEPLVVMEPVVKAAEVEVTFSEKPHVNNWPRLYYLRQGLIEGFLQIAEGFNKQGWVLHIEDGYRSPEMQEGQWEQSFTFDVIFERLQWELEGAAVDPDLLHRRMAALVAMSPIVSTHISGSAIDISMFDRKSGKEIDRGGPYAEFSHLTPMNSPFLSAHAAANRQLMVDLFAEQGFMTYPYEFWHFNKDDVYDAYLNPTGKPAKYEPVNVNWETLETTPMANQQIAFKSEADIQEMIQRRQA